MFFITYRWLFQSLILVPNNPAFLSISYCKWHDLKRCLEKTQAQGIRVFFTSKLKKRSPKLFHKISLFRVVPYLKLFISAKVLPRDGRAVVWERGAAAGSRRSNKDQSCSCPSKLTLARREGKGIYVAKGQVCWKLWWKRDVGPSDHRGHAVQSGTTHDRSSQPDVCAQVMGAIECLCRFLCSDTPSSVTLRWKIVTCSNIKLSCLSGYFGSNFCAALQWAL